MDGREKKKKNRGNLYMDVDFQLFERIQEVLM